MSLRFAITLALAGAAACRPYDYKVADAHAPESGLSAYQSVSIEVGVAPGVDTEAEDIASFTNDVEARVRDTHVITDVRRAPAPAELVLRVRVTKLEPKESFSLQHGTTHWFETAADVELYDVGRATSVGRFVVTAGPGNVFAPLQPKRTMAGTVYRNAARAVAAQLKKRR